MSSFRRRNVVVAEGKSVLSETKSAPKQVLAQGLRPSPLDGRFTTSSGTRSLDSLLAGHAGLALGTSLLVEETGTTDFGGCLLRYYASEGVVQGHHVHVLGMTEGWGKDLPGLVDIGDASGSSVSKEVGERMKIAWRYERLREFGTGARGKEL
jgi:elongator complex protein 4